MRVYIYVCIYIYIHTYIHTITYTDIYKCTHKHRMSAYASKFVAAARLYGHLVSAVYFMMSSLLQAVFDAAAIIIYVRQMPLLLHSSRCKPWTESGCLSLEQLKLHAPHNASCGLFEQQTWPSAALQVYSALRISPWLQSCASPESSG